MGKRDAVGPPQAPQLWTEFDEHVRYEVELLAYMVGALLDGNFDKAAHPTLPSDAIRNALIECMLIHARGLYEFLVKPLEKRVRKDMDPSDFLTIAWVAPQFSVACSAEKERIDLEVAHLTYGRKLPGDPAKPWTALFPGEVLREMKGFYACVGRPFPAVAERVIARLQVTAGAVPYSPTVVGAPLGRGITGAANATAVGAPLGRGITGAANATVGVVGPLGPRKT